MHLSRRRSSEIASLVYRKYRQRHGQFIVEGERAVRSAVAAGADIAEIIVSETYDDSTLRDALPASLSAQIITVSPDVFGKLSDVHTTQGVLAVVALRELPTDDVFHHQRLVAFEALQDPGNVGTIIRTAAWFGIDAIIATKGTADVFSPKVVRATMGAIFDVGIHVCEDLSEFLDQAHQKGFESVAADMDGEPLDQWRPAQRTLLIVGNEGAGVSAAVSGGVSLRVTIGRPGHAGDGGVESLNVAVAAGIIMNRWAHY